MVVPYCTIGYRSGVFAQKLIDSKLHLHEQGVEVKNGQGVVVWSYCDELQLVRREDGVELPTLELHTYGSPWDLAHPRYKPTHFGYLGMCLKALKKACCSNKSRL